jgi:beta-galactosidase
MLNTFCSLACFFIATLSFAEGDWAQSLNGQWRFLLTAPDQAGPENSFYRQDFDDKAFSAITVPSNWEMMGFEKFYYDHPSDSLGLYRTAFEIPKSWRQRRTFIRLDGVAFGFDLWINGDRVGSSISAFTPSQFDVTSYIHPGKENLLAVLVSKRTHGYEFDCHDDWALSGIFRDVTLISRPDIHIEDLYVTTKAGAPAEVIARTKIAACEGEFSPSGFTISGEIRDAGGDSVAKFDAPVSEAQPVENNVSIKDPKLWTAETPYLYSIAVTLKKNGKTIDQVQRNIGIRTVSIENGVLKLNGIPIKLHGVDRHTIDPAAGRTFTDELEQKDIALMKAANINAIRASHNPPEQRFMDLCDQQGLYVICEVPFGGAGIHLEDPYYQDDLLKRANATVMRDRSRPSVIIWSVGNENPYTPLVENTVKRVKELDPSRPVCLPEMNHYAVKALPTLPDFIDVLAPHYPSESQLIGWAQTLNRPVLATEFCHALGAAFEGLRPLWETMQHNDHLAGGCIWHWCDQGLYRNAEPGEFAADANHPLSGKVYLSQDRLMDSFGDKGSDGIVYADRRPQVDYWITRNVFSPAQFPDRVLKIRPGEQTIEVAVENRYDFTDFSSHKFTWKLRQNNSLLREGEFKTALAPRQSAKVPIQVNIPEDPSRNDFRLELACVNPAGVLLTESVIRLDPDSGQPDYRTILDQEIKQATKKNSAAKLQELELNLNKKTGASSIAAGDANHENLVSEIFARAGRKPVMAERQVGYRIYHNQDFFWEPYLLSPAQDEFLSITRKGPSTRDWRIEARYPRIDNPTQDLRGNIAFHKDRLGWLDISYNLTPHNATGFLLEAGVALKLDPSLTEFRWLGDGPYYSYPATEDAAQHGVHHVCVKGLYFEGNRANVSILAATDKAGNGLGLLCAPSNIGFQAAKDGVILSHSAFVSGRGNKGTAPRSLHPAAETGEIRGEFRLIRLEAGSWPGLFLRIFNADKITEEAETSPYARVYD